MKRKGFTLAELLIVVAIIAVLVAISIPLFTNQLQKSRIAVDTANVRSAKAAAVAEFVSSGQKNATSYLYSGSEIVESSSDIKGYGKYDKSNQAEAIGATGTPKGNFVMVTIRRDGTVEASWQNATSIALAAVNDGTVTFTTSVNNNAVSDYSKSTLKDDKSAIKKIVFAEGSSLQNGNASSMFYDYPELREIDMSGVTLTKTDYSTFTKCPKLSKVTLPTLASGGYDIEGTWYYDEACTQPVTVGKRSNAYSRVDPSMSGKTIYRKVG